MDMTQDQSTIQAYEWYGQHNNHCYAVHYVYIYFYTTQ